MGGLIRDWSICSGPDAGYWTAERLGTSFFAESAGALGLVRAGQQVAGVIYENFNGKSLVAHMAVAGRLNATFIAAIFDYAFNVFKVEKVICPVSTANAKSRRLVENMGFGPEATLADAAPDGDLILYTLPRSECRFLEARYGKKLT